MSIVRCKTCDVGTLQLRKTYRMSGVVVTIGYILLVPSVLGMLFSGFLMFATGQAGMDTAAIVRDSAASRLREAGVSESITEKVINSQPLTEAETGALTQEQEILVESTKSVVTAGSIGAGAGKAIVGGLALFFGVASLLGGLLGWLLIMKKKVLRCENCGAVIAAS